MLQRRDAVGPWDLEVREDLILSRKPRFQMLLGVDGAGVVMATGSRVSCLIGDRVYSHNWANPKGGVYAEYVVVPADKVGPVPKRLDFEHAGAIATTGLTALQGIDYHLRVQRSESVIVRDGSGALKFADTKYCIVGDEWPSAAATRMSAPAIVGERRAGALVQIVDLKLKNPSSGHWQRSFEMLDLLL